MKPKQQNKSNVTELKNVVNKIFYISYDTQFLGSIAAKTIPEALRKATGRYGRHIIKDVSLLEAVDSGKYENP